MKAKISIASYSIRRSATLSSVVHAKGEAQRVGSPGFLGAQEFIPVSAPRLATPSRDELSTGLISGEVCLRFAVVLQIP